jgi:epoxyqueuosine reductase
MEKMRMSAFNQKEIVSQVIQRAKAFGASLAGIASTVSLRDSPSYKMHGPVEWPVEARSVLVLALVHQVSQPELDWWDSKKGGTPGNRQLIRMAKSLKKCLKEEFKIRVWPLPYHVEKGGIFLKDAAALAGLGIIGKNNLLVTPGYGPRVRLRALFLDVEPEPTGPIDFNPCEACTHMPCRRACPREAFGDSTYSRSLCNEQMQTDEANKVEVDRVECVKYCRACELACPV